MGVASPDLHDLLRAGVWGGLLAGLKTKGHPHGRRYTAPELCQRATRRPLTPGPLLGYLRGKLRAVYGLE